MSASAVPALRSVAPPAAAAEPNFRQAPHNIEAEQALLGAIIVNNDAFERVSPFLLPAHFFEPIHAKIYEVITALLQANKVATHVTIKTFMDPALDVAGMTVTQYIARLAAEAITIINAEDYGRIIYDLAIRRMLITVGENMVNSAYDAPVDNPPREQIEEAEKQLFALAETGNANTGFQTFLSTVGKAIDMASAAYQRDGNLSGIATGLTELDRKMGGLQPSDLIILAGRPAMGKTALVTNIAFNVAKNYKFEVLADGTHKTINGGVVGFFSLEMSAEQLATRIIAEQAGIPSYKIRRGDLDEPDFYRLQNVAAEIASLPLYIDDTGGLSIAQLVARARRLKRQRGLDLLIVDYLQLLSGSKKAGENRVQELTEITTSMKAIAKELKVPVIGLSQLSRQVEQRDDKRPQLADLRESGSIEQDADVVMFVYREEYYLQSKTPKEGTDEYLKWMKTMEEVHGKAEVIIGKQRHGPTGTVELQFDANVTRFSDLADADRLPERME